METMVQLAASYRNYLMWGRNGDARQSSAATSALSKQDSKLVLGIWLHLELRLLCGSRLEIEESSNGEIKGIALKVVDVRR